MVGDGGYHEFKGKTFFNAERLYTGGDYIPAGPFSGIEGEEEKGYPDRYA